MATWFISAMNRKKIVNSSAGVFLGMAMFFLTGCGFKIKHDQWETGYKHVQGHRFFYSRTGGYKPVMVMLHDYADDNTCFTTFARLLENEYDIIMYDARGHGNTEAPQFGYTIHEMGEDLIELMRKLHVRKPILYGHGMGGAVSIYISYTWPEIPRAIILENPSGLHILKRYIGDDLIAIQLEQKKIMVRHFKMSTDELATKCREEIFPNWLYPYDCECWAKSKTKLNPGVIYAYASWDELYRYMPGVSSPTLVILPDGTPTQKKKDMKRVSIIPGAELIHVEGTMKQIRRENPNLTKQIIQPFLDDVTYPFFLNINPFPISLQFND